MDDASRALKPWVTFAGCVLIIVILYWAQAVLVPIALAILLTFVLAPPVRWLERRIGLVRGGADRSRARDGRRRTGGLGSGAAAGPSRRGSPPVPHEHLHEDRRCAHRGQGRLGRKAAGDDRRHQERSRRDCSAARRDLPAAGRGHLRTGCRLGGDRLARADGRMAGDGRARAGARALHATRTPEPAGSADRAHRTRTADDDDEGTSTRPARASAASC